MHIYINKRILSSFIQKIIVIIIKKYNILDDKNQL